MYLEHESYTLGRNVGNHLASVAASHPRRPEIGWGNYYIVDLRAAMYWRGCPHASRGCLL